MTTKNVMTSDGVVHALKPMRDLDGDGRVVCGLRGQVHNGQNKSGQRIQVSFTEATVNCIHCIANQWEFKGSA